MRLLLDTHVAIWAVAEQKRLPDRIRKLIAAVENEVYVSSVSVAEIAIKYAGGKRNAPPFSASVATGYFRGTGFLLINLTAENALMLEQLPPLHGDPFDRLLIAQALSEPLRLVTHDRKLATYSDTVISF